MTIIRWKSTMVVALLALALGVGACNDKSSNEEVTGKVHFDTSNVDTNVEFYNDTAAPNLNDSTINESGVPGQP